MVIPNCLTIDTLRMQKAYGRWSDGEMVKASTSRDLKNFKGSPQNSWIEN